MLLTLSYSTSPVYSAHGRAPNITLRLLAAFADTHTRPPQLIEPLTTREEEILVPVARGWTNREIADNLHISMSTVRPTLPA